MHRSVRIAQRLLPILVVIATGLLAPASAQMQQATTTDQQLDLIQQRTSRLRELSSQGTVGRTFMRREDLRAHYEATFFAENPIDEIENSQRLLELLGYIDPSVNIIDLLLDVLGQEVLGFYDRETKQIYVVSDRDSLTPADAVTMAHEYTHALQDQHFDLAKGFEDRKHNNDQALAYQALVEGDAVLLQSLYSLRYLNDSERSTIYADQSGGSVTRAIDTAPLILRRELYFPYEEGPSFLIKYYLDGAWDSIDAVWANPPASTEQILHPEKYQAGEMPADVAVPDIAGALGDGWRELDEDTIGELDWRILFEQYDGSSTAVRAAAGWGGDRYKLVGRDSDHAVAFEAKTVWDTEADATEFYDAYKQAVEARHGEALQPIAPSSFVGARPVSHQPDTAWGGSSGGFFHALVRDGSTVAVVTATDAAALNTIDLLW